MKKKLVAFFVCFLSALLAEAQSDSTRIRSWWLMYKIGSAQSNVSAFQRWALSEGVGGVSAVSRNTLIGFDILYNHNRMVYGMSSEFELRTFGETEPYFFSFTFRVGYQWLQASRFQVRSLGGIGAGYTLVRFEGQLPASLQNISANYVDPFARASLLIGRLELMASYNLYANPERRLLHFQPLLFVNAGMHPVLKHGFWNYGDSELDSFDGTRFVAQRIDMPKFYRENWFLTLGLALLIMPR